MTILEILASLAQAEQELKAKSENFEQALADEREAGRRDRDGEVAGLNEQMTQKQSEFEVTLAQRDQVFNDMIVQKDQERADFGASEYARGFEDGKLEGDPLSDKIYSQAELDSAVGNAVAPLQEQISGLTSQISEGVAREEALRNEMDVLRAELSQVDQKIADALAAFKADLLSKYDATQEDDAAFRESLR